MPPPRRVRVSSNALERAVKKQLRHLSVAEAIAVILDVLLYDAKDKRYSGRTAHLLSSRDADGLPYLGVFCSEMVSIPERTIFCKATEDLARNLFYAREIELLKGHLVFASMLGEGVISGDLLHSIMYWERADKDLKMLAASALAFGGYRGGAPQEFWKREGVQHRFPLPAMFALREYRNPFEVLRVLSAFDGPPDKKTIEGEHITEQCAWAVRQFRKRVDGKKQLKQLIEELPDWAEKYLEMEVFPRLGR